MRKQSRLRKLLSAPWTLSRFWRALNAWGESDWHRMIALLQPIAGHNVDTNSDRILLGLAHTRLGQWDQAIWYFEQVSGRVYLQRERIIYCNTFAYALSRSGRLAEAQTHVRGFARNDWPLEQRAWGERLLCSAADSELPEESVEAPRIFH